MNSYNPFLIWGVQYMYFYNKLLYSQAIHVSYLNKEYSVQGKSSSFKYTQLAFFVIFVIFSVTTAGQKLRHNFQLVRKNTAVEMCFSWYHNIFGINTGKTLASSVKSATDMILTLFQLRIVAVVSVWCLPSQLFFSQGHPTRI